MKNRRGAGIIGVMHSLVAGQSFASVSGVARMECIHHKTACGVCLHSGLEGRFSHGMSTALTPARTQADPRT